eukprot:1143124-Pelagomonas_calceolata.AAC.2
MPHWGCSLTPLNLMHSAVLCEHIANPAFTNTNPHARNSFGFKSRMLRLHQRVGMAGSRLHQAPQWLCMISSCILFNQDSSVRTEPAEVSNLPAQGSQVDDAYI